MFYQSSSRIFFGKTLNTSTKIVPRVAGSLFKPIPNSSCNFRQLDSIRQSKRSKLLFTVIRNSQFCKIQRRNTIKSVDLLYVFCTSGMLLLVLLLLLNSLCTSQQQTQVLGSTFFNSGGPNSDSELINFLLPIKNMLRARINYGSKKNLLHFLLKLEAGECTVNIAIGGSITFAHMDNCPEQECGYPHLLQELLNLHFPCNKTSSNSSDTAPKIHQVLNLALSATASDTHLSRIQSWLATRENIIWHSDLLIVESAVNDVEELEWYKVTKAGPVAAIQITTEVLIRQVRATLPNIGILYLGSTWRNFLEAALLLRCSGLPPVSHQILRCGSHLHA